MAFFCFLYLITWLNAEPCFHFFIPQKEEKKKKRKGRARKKENLQIEISTSALELKSFLFLQSQFRRCKTEFPARVVCLVSLGVCTVVPALTKIQRQHRSDVPAVLVYVGS